jgi:hypothetical protein
LRSTVRCHAAEDFAYAARSIGGVNSVPCSDTSSAAFRRTARKCETASPSGSWTASQINTTFPHMTIPRSPIFGRVPDLPFSGELGETAYLQKLFRKDLCAAARIYRRKFVLIINASITAQASAKRRYSTVWRCSPGPRARLPTAARPPGAVSRQRRRAHLCRRIAGNASSRAPTTPPTPGPGRAVCPSGWLVPHTTLARCR